MAGIQRILGQIICASTKNAASIFKENTSALPIIKPWVYCPEFYRFSSNFLSRVTAEQLWKGVTSVSNAGRKKGRGKGAGKKFSKDLNKGQVIGFGAKNMLWPGLNTPVVRGKEVVSQQELPPDDSRQQRIIELRDKIKGVKRLKLPPLERGWSGNKLPGRSLGPPDPIGNETFEGFDSRCLQFRVIVNMVGKHGRVRKMTSMAVVGNKKGLVGYGYASSRNGNVAAKTAKNRAAQCLRLIKLHEDRTVLHDFHATFGAIIIHVKQRPRGYGLRCHRAIRAICEMLGIKDMYAKVEGPAKRTHCLVRAFFIGLTRQQTHQQLADKVGLHLIEICSERDFYPNVLASPEKCRTEEEIESHEPVDYELVVNNNKVPDPELFKKPERFYIEFESYKKKLRDSERFRNHGDTKRQLTAKYGKLTSFLLVREEEKEKQKVKDSVEEAST